MLKRQVYVFVNIVTFTYQIEDLHKMKWEKMIINQSLEFIKKLKVNLIQFHFIFILFSILCHV